QSIPEKSKQAFREKGVAFMDGKGTLYIPKPDGTEFFKGIEKPKTVSKTDRIHSTNVNGLKIIFTLLTEPELLYRGYPAISEYTGLPLSKVVLTIRALRNLGYLKILNKQAILLQNGNALLEKWIEGYRDTLK